MFKTSSDNYEIAVSKILQSLDETGTLANINNVPSGDYKNMIKYIESQNFTEIGEDGKLRVSKYGREYIQRYMK